jgi:hypothetical protein
MVKPVRFDVHFAKGTGRFEILEDDALAATGHITVVPTTHASRRMPFAHSIGSEQFSHCLTHCPRQIEACLLVPNDAAPFYYEAIEHSNESSNSYADSIHVTTEDIYKEFLLRGYEYGVLKYQIIVLCAFSGRFSRHPLVGQCRCTRSR